MKKLAYLGMLALTITTLSSCCGKSPNHPAVIIEETEDESTQNVEGEDIDVIEVSKGTDYKEVTE